VDSFHRFANNHRYFGVTKEKVDRALKPITIMHPGPINRDVELSADLADGLIRHSRQSPKR